MSNLFLDLRSDPMSYLRDGAALGAVVLLVSMVGAWTDILASLP